MIVVSKKKYESIHQDYKGVFEREDDPSFIGRRTVMSGQVSDEKGALLIEGVHFIVEDNDDLTLNERRAKNIASIYVDNFIYSPTLPFSTNIHHTNVDGGDIEVWIQHISPGKKGDKPMAFYNFREKGSKTSLDDFYTFFEKCVLGCGLVHTLSSFLTNGSDEITVLEPKNYEDYREAVYKVIERYVDTNIPTKVVWNVYSGTFRTVVENYCVATIEDGKLDFSRMYDMAIKHEVDNCGIPEIEVTDVLWTAKLLSAYLSTVEKIKSKGA